MTLIKSLDEFQQIAERAREYRRKVGEWKLEETDQERIKMLAGMRKMYQKIEEKCFQIVDGKADLNCGCNLEEYAYFSERLGLRVQTVLEKIFDTDCPPAMITKISADPYEAAFEAFALAEKYHSRSGKEEGK